MAMLEDMIKTVFKKLLATQYQHLQQPTIVKARVMSTATVGDLRRYTVRIIDKGGELDAHFPALPNVLSRLVLDVGDTVAVGLMYGELDPVILTEVF